MRCAELFSFKDEPNLAESPKLKKHAMSVMNTVDVAVKGLADLEPRGLTPLAAATNLITAKIVPMAPGLMMKNQRVCVVIATDGQPSDDGFQAALGRLQALPVWVVVRICTDEDSVIDYYNGLDAEMEAPMEVLDDLLGEAHEVCKLNRWLTYGPPMHTARVSARFQPPPLCPVVTL